MRYAAQLGSVPCVRELIVAGASLGHGDEPHPHQGLAPPPVDARGGKKAAVARVKRQHEKVDMPPMCRTPIELAAGHFPGADVHLERSLKCAVRRRLVVSVVSSSRGCRRERRGAVCRVVRCASMWMPSSSERRACTRCVCVRGLRCSRRRARAHPRAVTTARDDDGVARRRAQVRAAARSRGGGARRARRAARRGRGGGARARRRAARPAQSATDGFALLLRLRLRLFPPCPAPPPSPPERVSSCVSSSATPSRHRLLAGVAVVWRVSRRSSHAPRGHLSCALARVSRRAAARPSGAGEARVPPQRAVAPARWRGGMRVGGGIGGGGGLIIALGRRRSRTHLSLFLSRSLSSCALRSCHAHNLASSRAAAAFY